MFQDGTLQGLCYELPQDKDSQNKLFASIPPVLEQVLAERKTSWQGPYDFTFDLAHPDVLRVHFTVEQLVKKTITNILEDYPSEIEITRVVWDPVNVTFDLYFNYTSSLSIGLTGPLILEGLKTYFIDIFSYPNTSFVTTIPDFRNLSDLHVRAYIPNYHCEPPAPFFGTYCWLDKWYSEGMITVNSEDLIASPSTSFHQGTLMVTNHLKIDNSSLVITGNLIINSLYGIFQISNSSLSPTKLEIYDSIIEINGNSSIDAKELVLDKATLRVVLSNEDLLLLENKHSIEITGISALKIENYFNQVDIIGNITNTECPVTTNQYRTDKRLIISVQIPDCNSTPDLQFIITVSVLCGLVFAIIIAAIIVYKHKQEIARTLSNLREQVQKSREIN